jgi:hypothetical protein
VRIEIDLHGYYPEQAQLRLERELFSAYSSGVTDLVIIHGKGAGVLKEAVLSTLYANKDKWINLTKGEETQEIGDSGFTKVRIKTKEIVKKFYIPKTKKEIKETNENSNCFSHEKIKQKKEKGKNRYLKMIKRRGMR